MNYVTNAIDTTINEYLRRSPADAPALSMVKSALLYSHKYVLPPPRTFSTRVSTESLDFIRMPFPEMVFEYEVPDAGTHAIDGLTIENTTRSTKRICLLIDLSTSKSSLAALCKKLHPDVTKWDRAILAYPIYYLDSYSIWAPCAGYGVWTPQQPSEFSIDGTDNAVAYAVGPLLPSLVNKLNAYNTSVELAIRNDVHEDLSVCLRALALINARNVHTVSVCAEPTALNKKRETKGKTPFFSYSTLNVFLSADSRLKSRKLINAEYLNSKGWSLGAAKKLHSVAGHFKRRKSGLFWWSSFFRGQREKGETEATHVVI